MRALLTLLTLSAASSSFFNNSAMAWRCSALSNDGLVDNLARAGLVQSQRVARAMRATDRTHFLTPPAAPELAYQDAPQLIGHQQTISAPHMVRLKRVWSLSLVRTHPYNMFDDGSTRMRSNLRTWRSGT